MGCSYRAHTVIGIRVNPAMLFELKRVKAFEHDHPEDWEVDPKTGKKLWAMESVPVAGVEGLDRDNTTVAGYPVVYGQEGEEAYIALHHQEVHSDGGSSNPAFMEIKTKELDLADEVYAMVNKLVPLGFWDPYSFGLHTFMVVSC
jgi:hypothetical protein